MLPVFHIFTSVQYLTTVPVKSEYMHIVTVTVVSGSHLRLLYRGLFSSGHDSEDFDFECVELSSKVFD
jgi:hypothetical protein